MFTTIVGYLATATGTCLMLPQFYKTLKTKSVKDVSWGMLIVYFFNCIFWLTYGLLLGAIPIILTNAIALVISIAQVFLQVKYSKNWPK
ncbi:MAG: SemiSWEET family transporter [bacterium]|nr:SemiSWEET family transporter [bacterium]